MQVIWDVMKLVWRICNGSSLESMQLARYHTKIKLYEARTICTYTGIYGLFGGNSFVMQENIIRGNCLGVYLLEVSKMCYMCNIV